VNGLLNRVDGRLSASFVVDGQNSSASNFAPFDGEQEDTDSSRWMLSQQFFHQDLPLGEHTLVATLVDVSGPQVSSSLNWPVSHAEPGGLFLIGVNAVILLDVVDRFRCV
jgi:hypothetical protein